MCTIVQRRKVFRAKSISDFLPYKDMYQILLLSASFSAWQFARLVLEGINLRISIITKSLCNFTLFPMSSKYQVSPWMTSFWHQNEFQERQHIILLQLLYYYSKMTEFEGEIFTISMVLSSTYHIHIVGKVILFHFRKVFEEFCQILSKVCANNALSYERVSFNIRKNFALLIWSKLIDF